jgi:hypothetical protein
MAFVLKQNDTSPAISAVLKDSAGAVIDLSSASVVFHMKAIGASTLKVDASALLQTLRMVPFSMIGSQVIQTLRVPTMLSFKVTYTDGSVESFPNTENLACNHYSGTWLMPTWTRHLYEHNPLAIAKGEVNGYSVVHKFGANFDIDNNSEPETVWTGGGLYPWSSLATAQTLYVLSESSEDTGTLEIQGLDENYNLQTEELTLTGTTAVTTVNTFLRVYRMIYTDGGAGNAGIITTRVGSSSGVVVAQIELVFHKPLCVSTPFLLVILLI